MGVEDDFSVQLSTFCRKRPHPETSRHSPPLRSPEPIAKKRCSRSTPPPSPTSGENGNGNRRTSSTNGVRNGHSSNGNGTSHTQMEVEEIEVDKSESPQKSQQPPEESDPGTPSRRNSRRVSRK